MNSNITFGTWEAVSIMLNAMSTQILLYFPGVMIKIGGTAGWIVSFYISILALILFFIITKLYEPFEGQDPLDIAQDYGKDVLRIITGVFYSVHIIIIIALVFREFSEDIKVISLTASPISYVGLFFLSGMIIAAFIGIEGIVRFSAIAIPIVLLGFLIIIVGVFRYVDIDNTFPIFGNGTFDIFIKGSIRVSSYSSLVILFLIYPFIKRKDIFKRTGYISIGIASFLMTLSCFIYIVVVPYPVSKESFLPLYMLARLIDYGRFFQRIESVFVIAWATSALMYLSVGFYMSIIVFQKTFKLKYYKPLIIPFAIILFTISFLPKSLMETLIIENSIGRLIALVDTFLVTGFVLIYANIAKKRRENN